MTQPIDDARRAAILSAIHDLSESEMANAGTSSDCLYKIAKPNSRLNLDLEMCARLDAALVARGKAAVFSNLYQQTFNEALTGQPVTALEIESELRRLYVEAGTVSQTVDDAMADGILTLNEYRDISRDAGKVARVALAIRDHCNEQTRPRVVEAAE